MDPHLEHIPRLATLTTGSLARGDFERLGGEADRALDAEVLGLGALEELTAHFFKGRDLARRQGYADFVDFLSETWLARWVCGGERGKGKTYGAVGHGLFGLLERHLGRWAEMYSAS